MESNRQVETVLKLQKAGILLVEDGNHGEYRPRRDEFVENGTAFIRAADMANGRVLFESAQCINETAEQRIRKGKGQPGDILLSHKGTIGKIAYVPYDAPPFVCSPQTTFWRSLAPEQLDPKYLLFFLQSYHFQTQLHARANETDMAGYVSLTAQRSFNVILPCIQEQREIANILGTLDDKIELNRRMNRTLEAMTQAIFKSWFVDFEPVKAKQQARAAGESVELAAMMALSGKSAAEIEQLPVAQRASLAETAALFPERLVESELGLIPEGWEWHQSSQLFDVKDGTHDSPKRVETGFHLITSKHIKSGSIDYESAYRISQKDYIAVNRRSKVDRLDVLLTMIGTVGIPLIVLDKKIEFAIKNVGLFKTSTAPNQAFYFYLLLQTHAMKHFLEARFAGTTQQYISLTELRKIPIQYPGEDLLNHFHSVISPIFESIYQNNDQAKSLAQLRDTLLPKLLSGELTIPDAMAQTEEVLS